MNMNVQYTPCSLKGSRFHQMMERSCPLPHLQQSVTNFPEDEWRRKWEGSGNVQVQ